MTFFKNYAVQLLLMSCAVLGISLLLQRLHNRFFDCSHVYVITLFFTITTWLANIIYKKGERQSKDFIMKIMAVSMGRLLLCMVMVFVYSLANKPQALGFACHFMIQYVLFTIFELTYLLKFIKQSINTPTKHEEDHP